MLYKRTRQISLETSYCATLHDLRVSTNFGGFCVIDMNTFCTWTTDILTRNRRCKLEQINHTVDCNERGLKIFDVFHNKIFKVNKYAKQMRL